MKEKPKDIKDIEQRLESFKKNQADSIKKTYTGGQVGFKIVIDFVSAIAIGGCLGLFLDETLETKPFMFIFMILCGFGAGFLNIYRFLKNREKEEF